MRLRVIPLPQADAAPYLVILDRVPEDWPVKETMEGINEGMKERSGGGCHGFLVFHGELDIE